MPKRKRKHPKKTQRGGFLTHAFGAAADYAAANAWRSAKKKGYDKKAKEAGIKWLMKNQSKFR